MEEKKENILDEVSAAKGVQPPEEKLTPKQTKIRKIIIVISVLLVYGGIITTLFLTKSIWALFGLIAYCILLVPILKFLKKHLKIEEEKLKY